MTTSQRALPFILPAGKAPRCQSLDGCRKEASVAVIKAGAVLELCPGCQTKHVKHYGWQAVTA